jgi:hypothetical protein
MVFGEFYPNPCGHLHRQAEAVTQERPSATQVGIEAPCAGAATRRLKVEGAEGI